MQAAPPLLLAVIVELLIVMFPQELVPLSSYMFFIEIKGKEKECITTIYQYFTKTTQRDNEFLFSLNRVNFVTLKISLYFYSLKMTI